MSFATQSVTQPTIACSEHELVAAVRRGDDRAFEQLYSRYRGRISSYVFGMVGDHGRAEDIAQEVFISALRRLRDTERPIAFKPWIYEIAKNACIDEFRRTRRTREVPLESEEGEGDGQLQSRGPTPDAAIQNKQSLDDLRGAFHGLSENHHKLIVMRELEGLSYEQIGEQLGMSRPMVESTLFRARRKLTEEYEELVSGRRCEHVQTLIADDQRRSLLKLGVRERRQLARHLAHCQPCRREARMAGVDESFFQAPRTLAGKIAALLPIPWLRRWRSHGGGGEDGVSAATPHSYNAVQNLQSVAQLVDPSGPTAGLGRAAAAVAAVAVAGIGGGVVSGVAASHGGPSRPQPSAVHAPAAAAQSAKPIAPFVVHSVKASGPAKRAAAKRGAGKHSGAGGSSSGSGAGSGGGTASGSSGGGSTGSTASGAVQNTVNKVTQATGSTSGTKLTLTTPTLPSLTTSLPQITLTTPQLPNVGTVINHVRLPSPNQLLNSLTHLG